MALTPLLLFGLALRLNALETSVRVLQPSADESISAIQADMIRGGDISLLFLAQPYMFPIESYVLAPLLPLFPAGGEAAIRVPIALLHLVAAALLALLVARSTTGLARAIGLVLIAIPSGYVLLIQSAYSPPGYASLVALFSATAWCAHRSRVPGASPGWIAATGACASLAFSGHMLALPFVLAGAAYAIPTGGLRSAVRRGGIFGGGLVLGLLPFLAAKLRFEGAHAAVAEPMDWIHLPRRLWTPTLDHTLMGALGIRLPLFPDSTAIRIAPEAAATSLAWIAAAAILALAAWRLARVVRRKPLELTDFFAITLFANLALFVVSDRANSISFRYLLLSALAVPPLLALVANRGRIARIVCAVAAFVLLAFHISGARKLHDAWTRPDFAEDVAAVPDLRPALDRLRALGIRHAVASYGAAYRITYQAAGDIVAAQPFNERFPSWPIPFKAEVDAAPLLAYVLTERIRFLKPSVFARHLRTMGVDATATTNGSFVVFHGFASTSLFDHAASTRLREFDATTSWGSLDSSFWRDGSPETFTRTPERQAGGEWIEATWDTPSPVTAVTLDAGRAAGEFPDALCVRVRRGTAWETAVDNTPGGPDKFRYEAGKPLYGRWTRTIRLDGSAIDGVRIESAAPRRDRRWSIADLEIHLPPASTP